MSEQIRRCSAHKNRRRAADALRMPTGPVAVLFGIVFFAVTGFGEWIIRHSPPSLPWKPGGGIRALRVERVLIRILMGVSACVGLSLLIVGITDL